MHFARLETCLRLFYFLSKIRYIKRDEEIWFVAVDLCRALGYANPRDALAKHVDDDERGVAKCDTLGGVQTMAIINESGLYSLISDNFLANNFVLIEFAHQLPILCHFQVVAVRAGVCNTYFSFFIAEKSSSGYNCLVQVQIQPL